MVRDELQILAPRTSFNLKALSYSTVSVGVVQVKAGYLVMWLFSKFDELRRYCCVNVIFRDLLLELLSYEITVVGVRVISSG